jgi:hypothetical protein
MTGLTNALQELRAERQGAQLQLEKLDRAISVMESLSGSGSSQKANQPTRVRSAASRRKMALAQQARWAKVRNGSQPGVGSAKTSVPPLVKRTISAAGRKRIAAAQKSRWAKVKAANKKQAA